MFQPVLFFILLFLLLYARVVRWSLPSWGRTWISWVQQQKLFPPLPLETDLRQLNIIRIIAGTVLLLRSLFTLYFSLHLQAAPVEMISVLLLCLLSLALILGVFTPITATLLFLGCDLVLEEFTRTLSLGTLTLQIILGMMVFLPAGTMLSVDQHLVRQQNTLGRFLSRLYAGFGKPQREKILLLRFISFLSFGYLCFTSALAHLHDPYWSQGLANLYILTSPYLSTFYPQFQALFQTAPKLFILLSQLSSWGMILWELLFFLAVLFPTPLRGMALLWGLLFFLASATLLQVQGLPYFELTLFAMLFWPLLQRTTDPQAKEATPPADRSPTWPPFFQAGLLSYGVIFLMALVEVPYVYTYHQPYPQWSSWNKTLSKLFPYTITPRIFGLTPLGVFNSLDIEVSQYFFTLKRVSPTGQTEPVPLNGPHGERGFWQKFDRVLYGEDFRWKYTVYQELQTPTPHTACLSAATAPYIQDLARMDRNIFHLKSQPYRYQLFYQRLIPPEALLKQANSVYEAPQALCSSALPLPH